MLFTKNVLNYCGTHVRRQIMVSGTMIPSVQGRRQTYYSGGGGGGYRVHRLLTKIETTY